MPFVESAREFIARHGDYVEIKGRFIFADGAKCDPQGMIKTEPPTTEIALLQARLPYYKEKCRRAEVNFREYRDRILEQDSMSRRYSNLPGPPSEAPKVLRELQAIVKECREELKPLEDELQAGSIDEGRLRREAVRQDQLRAQGDMMQDFKSIDI